MGCSPEPGRRQGAAATRGEVAGRQGVEQSSVLDDVYAWFTGNVDILGEAQAAGEPVRPDSVASESSDCSSQESENEEDDGVEEQYFAVRVSTEKPDRTPVEKDVIDRRCRELRKLMRERPTLPLGPDGTALTAADLETGMQLPLYSCPFQNNQHGPCHFHPLHIRLHHRWSSGLIWTLAPPVSR